MLAASNEMLDIDGRLHLAARVEGKRDLLLMEPVKIPDDNFVDWSLERDLSRSSVSFFPLR